MNVLFRIWTLLSMFAFTCHAQSVDQDLKHYNDVSGLPQNSVRSIAQDKAGFLWMTTEAGLVRFDGGAFKTFNSPGLSTSTNRFTHFEMMDTDDIYAWNADQECFKVENGQVYPVEVRNIRRLRGKEEQNGIMWSRGEWDRTRDAHYLRLNSWRQINIRANKDESYECFHNKIVYRGKGGQVVEIRINVRDFWGLFVLNSRLYYRSPEGLFFTFAGDKVQPVGLSGALKGRHLGTSIVMWNGTSSDAVAIRYENKIYLAESDKDGVLQTRIWYNSFDFTENQVVASYFDKKRSTLWLGTLNNGIYQLKRKLFISVGAKGREHAAVFYALAALNDSTVLAPGGLIARRDGSSEIKYPVLAKLGPDKRTILKDNSGNIWVTNDRTVTELDPLLKKRRQWKFPSGIVVIAQGQGDDIWIAGRSPGLFRIDKGKVDINYQVVLPQLHEISSIVATGSDELLIGTRKGLYTYKIRQRELGKISEFGDRYVRSIYPRGGEVWITTYEEGIFLFDGKRLTHFPADKAGFLNTAHCIVEDNLGFFWISANRGIFKVSRQQLLESSKEGSALSPFYSYYDANDGFIINEFNGGCQPCGVKLSNGEIAFPSMRGIVMFNPMDSQATLPSEPIFIDHVTVDAELPAIGTHLRVKHNYSLITIQIATAYFGNPSNVRIEYAVSKSGKEEILSWLPVNRQRSVLLSRLPSGNYKILMRKVTGFTKDNFAYRSLELTVLPTWYESWWFIGTISMVFIFVTWCFIRLRTRQLKMQNDKLANLVSHKTSNLQASLSSLEIAQQELKQQMQLYQRLIGAVGHDIKTPLVYLTKSSKMLFLELEQKGGQLPAELIELGKDNFEYTERILSLTENLLDFVKTKISNAGEEEIEINLHALVEGKIAIFEKIARFQRSNLINRVEDGLVFRCAPRPLSVILHNLIDNALKATRDGVVCIYTSRYGENIVLNVDDDGIGVPQAVLDWVNSSESPIQQKSGVSERLAHSGLGLSLALELATPAGLTIRMERKQPFGTIVKVIFSWTNQT